jgi:hypothetical protein
MADFLALPAGNASRRRPLISAIDRAPVRQEYFDSINVPAASFLFYYPLPLLIISRQ